MSDSEKPKSWRERIKRIKHKLMDWCASLNQKCKSTERRFDQCAILNILGHAGRPAAFLTIIAGMVFYMIGCPKRQMQAEDQRRTTHYQAWQIIKSGMGQRSSGGRVQALQDLNKDKVSLAGVDISKAYLLDLNLKNANLTEAILTDANLPGAILSNANLTEANFYFADLTGADLSDADLTGTFLQLTNFAEANLSHANLNNIRFWQEIKSIEKANIYDVKNPPDGFVEWAKEQGAVSIKDDREWEKFLREKIQEQIKEK